MENRSRVRLAPTVTVSCEGSPRFHSVNALEFSAQFSCALGICGFGGAGTMNTPFDVRLVSWLWPPNDALRLTLPH